MPTGADALPSLRREANELLGGGPRAFKARLAGLRGHPVVVNQWASWCGPCRYEFPFFARLARRYAADGKLAFTRLGGYATEAKLDEDIKRYALDG